MSGCDFRSGRHHPHPLPLLQLGQTLWLSRSPEILVNTAWFPSRLSSISLLQVSPLKMKSTFVFGCRP